MTTNNANLTAKWDANQGMYIVRELGIWSEDGNDWHDDFGGQPDSDEFHAATFTFEGGPRHGEQVS